MPITADDSLPDQPSKRFKARRTRPLWLLLLLLPLLALLPSAVSEAHGIDVTIGDYWLHMGRTDNFPSPRPFFWVNHERTQGLNTNENVNLVYTIDASPVAVGSWGYLVSLRHWPGP